MQVSKYATDFYEANIWLPVSLLQISGSPNMEPLLRASCDLAANIAVNLQQPLLLLDLQQFCRKMSTTLNHALSVVRCSKLHEIKVETSPL